jgi:hypothetical protein
MTTAATLTIGIAPAPAAQGKGDRVAQPRAPKGGWLDQATGVFYKGGTFVPATFAGNPIPTTPAPLVGSWRQTAWADRLRREELNRIEVAGAAMRSALEVARRERAAELRAEIKAALTEGWKLAHERSAVAIIERKMAKVG